MKAQEQEVKRAEGRENEGRMEGAWVRVCMLLMGRIERPKMKGRGSGKRGGGVHQRLPSARPGPLGLPQRQ